MKVRAYAQLVKDKRFMQGVRNFVYSFNRKGICGDVAATLQESLAYWQKIKVSRSDCRKLVKGF